jgi:hypothetical protein
MPKSIILLDNWQLSILFYCHGEGKLTYGFLLDYCFNSYAA